jgi:putative spermidine/putrescine transport system substrate-binding protein
MRRDALASLDAVQMALGKDPANLYPLDLRACLAKVREIRRNAVFWNSARERAVPPHGRGGDGPDLAHPRERLSRETNGRIKFIWNQGLLQAGIFVIPRGNAGGELAQRLLASMLSRPEPQVGLLQFLGNGPTNPAAAAQVPAEFRAVNPTDPDNARQQVVLNGVWWGENYQQANQDFLDVVTG